VSRPAWPARFCSNAEVAPGAVIEGEDGADGDGADDGLGHALGRHDHERGEHDDDVDRHLDLAGAEAFGLLQPLRQDVDAADAGVVAEQGEQAEADQEAAQDRSEPGVDEFKPHQFGRHGGAQRDQGHGGKALEGEFAPEPEPR
jgi:hypothetical protein